jgi:hypothetical protein
MNQLHERTRLLDRQEGGELCEKTLLLTRDMMRLGTSSEDCACMVSSALQSSYTAQEIDKLRNTFMHQTRFQTPNDLANQYAHQIQNGVDAENIGGSGPVPTGEVPIQANKPEDSGSAGADGTGGGSGSNGAGNSGGSGDSGSSGKGSGKK